MKWHPLTGDVLNRRGWRSWLRACVPSPAQGWSDIRLGLILLVLIILPSGVLGYFSWRAFENEKLVSEHRLEESYRQLARLASHEIDRELDKLERQWLARVDDLFAGENSVPDADVLRRFTAEESLIRASFLVTMEEKVAYPSGIRIRDESAASAWASDDGERQSYLRERELFSQLAAQGEELEYHEYDLVGALRVYRSILSKVSNPQLRAMAENMSGRVLIKNVEWERALSTFRRLLEEYPEVRNFHNMYLRFVAQYQIAVALENLDKDEEAIQTLLGLNRDLLERSDRINHLQYSHFLELIKNLTPRLLTSPTIVDPAGYQSQFDQLAEQSKERYSEQYFLQFLDRRLNELGVEQKHYREKYRYVSDEADDEPFLLAYRLLPDPSKIYAAGIFGFQIDLRELSQQLFPTILQNLKFNEEVSLAILNQRGGFVIGTKGINSKPIALLPLARPFDFWKVAAYRTPSPTGTHPFEVFTTFGLGLIGILFCSIVIGAFLFVRRVREANYLSQMKSTFISNVSHEIRTPLASVRMMAELLEMDLADRSMPSTGNFRQRAEQYLGIIRRECDRLNRLIENILDLSRIERGAKQYNLEYEDPMEVIQRAVEAFRPHAEAQGFTLNIRTAGDCPEVLMDADAISQVMFNLLSNAVKYSEDHKAIDVRVSVMKPVVMVEVRDQGIGIPATEINHICDAFYRVDQRLNSQKQGGAGLGLALVQQIIKAHGGELSVKSQMDKGSTFLFTLPIPTESSDLNDRLVPLERTENNVTRTQDQIESKA